MSGECGYSIFMSNLSGKAFPSPPLSMILAAVFGHNICRLRKLSSILNLMRIYVMNSC